MNKTINKLTLIYYGFYALAIAMAACGYFYFAGKPPLVSEQSAAGTIITSVYIIFLIVSIPLALKLYNIKVKKLAVNADGGEKTAKYLKIASLRLLVIGMNLLTGIAFFYLLNSRSMIFCAAMAAIALVFCKPTEIKASQELEAPEDSIEEKL